jgi:hypothetical protein
MHKMEGRSQLFTLRVWPESTGDGAVEWRGKVQRVVDGETLYFRDWSDLHDFVFGAVTAQERSPDGEQTEVISDGEDRDDSRGER